MTISQLKHASVFIKLLHFEPAAGTIADISEYGLWVSSEELVKELRGNYPLPQPLQGAAKLAIFVPFSSVEWMVTAE